MPTRALEETAIAPLASAILIQGKFTAGPFVVDELSPKVMKLHGPAVQNLSPGDATVVLSTADGRNMLRLSATVTYSAWSAGFCAQARLSFVGLSADEEDQIQTVVARHLEASNVPVTIVLDVQRSRTRGIQRFLQSIGRRAIVASSNLEALWLLERLRSSCGTILVDRSFLTTNGPDVLLYLHNHFPDKRRILVLSAGEEAPSDLRALTWSVHGVLASPWTIDDLKSALGILPAQDTRTRGRILFVDDEPAVLSAIECRLHRYLNQYETVWVTSAEAALSETRARPFDVIVTDLHMPGMDGLMLLRTLKTHAPGAKRIVLSGYDTHAAKDVADVVLQKPCALDRLRLEILAPQLAA